MNTATTPVSQLGSVVQGVELTDLAKTFLRLLKRALVTPHRLLVLLGNIRCLREHRWQNQFRATLFLVLDHLADIGERRLDLARRV